MDVQTNGRDPKFVDGIIDLQTDVQFIIDV
jgi:hypothetical protein